MVTLDVSARVSGVRRPESGILIKLHGINELELDSVFMTPGLL